MRTARFFVLFKQQLKYCFPNLCSRNKFNWVFFIFSVQHSVLFLLDLTLMRVLVNYVPSVVTISSFTFTYFTFIYLLSYQVLFITFSILYYIMYTLSYPIIYCIYIKFHSIIGKYLYKLYIVIRVNMSSNYNIIYKNSSFTNETNKNKIIFFLEL